MKHELIMENWRGFVEEERLLKETFLLEQKLLEGRATWGDLAKFVAGADPKTWKNRMKRYGKAGLKAAAAAGLTAGAVALAPKVLVALGVAKAGPAVAQELIKLLGDDVETWTQDKVQAGLEKIGTGIGTFISSSQIMGAIDKITKGTPLARLNISDTITDVVDNKYEEEFYTWMNQWFKQHPSGPTGNPDEVIPKRWADSKFSEYLQSKHGVAVGVRVQMGAPGVQE